jgi:hypothetical protein
MKKAFLLLLILLLTFSCDKECDEEFGKIVTQEFTVTDFNQIIALTGVETIIKEASEYKVLVKTGENRMDNVRVEVIDGVLEMEADKNCKLLPSYDPVQVYVFTPDLQVIRNSSEHSIKSDGILRFPNLKILTESYESDYVNWGDFDLKIENNSIEIISNGLSRIHIEGATNQLNLNYPSGIGVFEGKDLATQHIVFFHRGENKLEINPQESLIGELFSTGDVLSYNHPAVVDVKAHFSGELIFK